MQETATQEVQEVQGPILTPREEDVIELVIEGYPNKEIASRLSISYETAKEHIHHLLKKTRLNNRTQLAIWAFKRKHKIE